MASWPLRFSKVRITAISVGDNVNEKQLKNVVSLPLSDNVFLASNYDDIQKNIKEISQASCKAGTVNDFTTHSPGQALFPLFPLFPLFLY